MFPHPPAGLSLSPPRGWERIGDCVGKKEAFLIETIRIISCQSFQRVGSGFDKPTLSNLGHAYPPTCQGQGLPPSRPRVPWGACATLPVPIFSNLCWNLSQKCTLGPPAPAPRLWPPSVGDCHVYLCLPTCLSPIPPTSSTAELLIAAFAFAPKSYVQSAKCHIPSSVSGISGAIRLQVIGFCVFEWFAKPRKNSQFLVFFFIPLVAYCIWLQCG